MLEPFWRPATEHDDTKIIELCRAFYLDESSGDKAPGDHISNTLLVLRREEVRGRAVVLESERSVVGYALLIPFWSNELGGEVCNIDELYIGPSFRHKGAGKALIEGILKGNTIWSGQPVAIELEVNPGNSKAQRFYSNIGFEAVKNLPLRFMIQTSDE